MAEHGGVAVQAGDPLTMGNEVDESILASFSVLQNFASSPLAHLILRNAVLALFELKGGAPTAEDILKLVDDDSYRAGVVKRLVEGTPEIWSEAWDSLGPKDNGHLHSPSQQRVLRRMELAEFWRDEWKTIPGEVKSKLVNDIRRSFT